MIEAITGLGTGFGQTGDQQQSSDASGPVLKKLGIQHTDPRLGPPRLFTDPVITADRALDYALANCGDARLSTFR